MKEKKYSLIIICVSLFITLSIVIFNYVMDPFMHYRYNDNFSYSLRTSYQRYQNNGIEKNMDYEAIIIGTSMTDNFKNSELEDLFNLKSIKLPFDGASYKEINDNLKTAFESNDNIQIVVRGLDYNRLLDSTESSRYDEDSYPTYLYNDNILDDYKYLLSKDTTVNSLLNLIDTLKGKETSFDDYSYWADSYSFGKEYIEYNRSQKTNTKTEYSTIDENNQLGNIQNNVIDICKENSNTEFYLFFSPYSIYYWDSLNQNGNLDRQIEAEEKAIEMMLECDNIKLFSFNDAFEIITNLDNYKDEGHYSAEINSYILQCMKNNEHLITKDNYKDYLNNIYNFYSTYNYEKLFK